MAMLSYSARQQQTDALLQMQERLSGTVQRLTVRVESLETELAAQKLHHRVLEKDLSRCYLRFSQHMDNSCSSSSMGKGKGTGYVGKGRDKAFADLVLRDSWARPVIVVKGTKGSGKATAAAAAAAATEASIDMDIDAWADCNYSGQPNFV